jgi:hypothetical protein
VLLISGLLSELITGEDKGAFSNSTFTFSYGSLEKSESVTFYLKSGNYSSKALMKSYLASSGVNCSMMLAAISERLESNSFLFLGLSSFFFLMLLVILNNSDSTVT